MSLSGHFLNPQDFLNALNTPGLYINSIHLTNKICHLCNKSLFAAKEPSADDLKAMQLPSKFAKFLCCCNVFVTP